MRVLLFGGAASEVATSNGAILAGCSAPTTLAKLVLLGPLLEAKEHRHLLYWRNVVDDITLQCCGPKLQVASQLSSG